MTKFENKTQAREHYSQLRAQGKLHGTIANAIEKWEKRRAIAAIPGPKKGRFAKQMALMRKPVIVTLGHRIAEEKLSAAKARHPRLREWSLGAKAGEKSYMREIGDNSNRRKRSTFQRGIVVQSVGQRLTAKVAELHLDGSEYRYTLPRGYRWKRDQLGLSISDRQGNDFHPTASDLLDGIKHCISRLKENAAARKMSQRKAKQELRMVRVAEREGARVCLRDSLFAGNCYAGSQAWALSHELNPSEHVKPSRLLALANGDASRVAIVVAQAIRRHRAEMAQGFCELARHRA